MNKKELSIVFLDAGTVDLKDISLNALCELGDVKLFDYSTKEEGWKRAELADIVISNKYKVDTETLSYWRQCRYICVAATGYNNINIADCMAGGVQVSNVSGYSTQSVVQHVFASLLSVVNQSTHYFDEVRKGRWGKTQDFTFIDHSILDLDEMVFGVIGTGNIGAKVAQIADAFGMTVILNSKHPTKYNGPGQIVSESELFAQSDIISVHVPLNSTTKELINKDSLSKMKEDATLINTARGPIINEVDLASHLLVNPKFKAILDVLSIEPPVGDHPLQSIDNCFITPHIAWASKGARTKLISGVCKNIISFVNGSPRNLVTD